MNRPDGGFPVMHVPRTQLYTRIPVALRYRRDAWACRCAGPRYRRHKDPVDCVSAWEVYAWRMRTGAMVQGRAAKALCWMAREFSR